VADIFDKEKRSHVMSLIKSKNTKAEKIVFAYLRKEGIYHQRHYSRVVGNPDLALPRKKKAVFINGDFWHGRHYERILKSKGPNDYWTKKLQKNMDRDISVSQRLKEEGWHIFTAWESDLTRKSTRMEVLEKIKNFLKT
jgi:DNA mismatch endonuclease (patch repair protein)